MAGGKLLHFCWLVLLNLLLYCRSVVGRPVGCSKTFHWPEPIPRAASPVYNGHGQVADRRTQGCTVILCVYKRICGSVGIGDCSDWRGCKRVPSADAAIIIAACILTPVAAALPAQSTVRSGVVMALVVMVRFRPYCLREMVRRFYCASSAVDDGRSVQKTDVDLIDRWLTRSGWLAGKDDGLGHRRA